MSPYELRGPKPEEISEFPSTFTPELCAQIIEETRPHLTPAKIGRGRARQVHPARVADNYKYRRDTEWSLELRKKVAEITDTSSIDYVEPVEVVRYPTGGFYYRHFDSAAGDRPFTFSVYLNDDYEGGYLFFDQLGALYERIPVGMGLLWANTKVLSHECRPVTEGEKWLVTVWVNFMTAEERAVSGQDPLGDDKEDYTDSPIIIPGEND